MASTEREREREREREKSVCVCVHTQLIGIIGRWYELYTCMSGKSVNYGLELVQEQFKGSNKRTVSVQPPTKRANFLVICPGLHPRTLLPLLCNRRFQRFKGVCTQRCVYTTKPGWGIVTLVVCALSTQCIKGGNVYHIWVGGGTPLTVTDLPCSCLFLILEVRFCFSKVVLDSCSFTSLSSCSLASSRRMAFYRNKSKYLSTNTHLFNTVGPFIQLLDSLNTGHSGCPEY